MWQSVSEQNGAHMRGLVAFLAALLLATAAQADSLNVFGLSLGGKVELPACEGPTGDGESPPDGASMCSSLRIANEQDVVFSMSNCPKYTFSCRFHAIMSADDTVAGFWIPTSGAGARALAHQSLSQKFGAPSSVSSELVQNGFGAKFVNKTYTWRKPGYVVTYYELWGGTNEGKISIETPASVRLESASRPRPASM